MRVLHMHYAQSSKIVNFHVDRVNCPPLGPSGHCSSPGGGGGGLSV